MQRNFLRGLLICVLPCALFGLFAAVGQYRKGIDLAGGTILVYEVDLEKAQQRAKLSRDPSASADAVQGLSSDQMQQLAESLKRRIDPADLRNVVIRPLGNSRVEIILPFTPSRKAADGQAKEGATEDFVQFVKNIVSHVGVLEFRILANDQDDRQALADAEALINSGTPADELEKFARKGSPPPGPAGPYKITLLGGDTETEGVQYAWNELDREERKTEGLQDSDAEKRSELYTRLAAARGKAVRYRDMLYYSRELKKDSPTKDDEGKKVEYFVLSRVSEDDSLRVGGDVTMYASPSTDKNSNPCISFTFNGAGSSQFSRMTGRNKPAGNFLRHMAILLDDKVQTAPVLQAQLSGGGIISNDSGGLPKEHVNQIVTILRSGALTAELKPNPVSENTVGPTLGRDTINKGVTAVGLAFAAVMVFMIVYYRFAGMVACTALLANLLLTIGFMVGVNAAFTLAGLAGIVLMLGMAVDANVLIYERLREEREKGATLQSAIRNGYDRALPTIIDTHLSSIFTAIVLYTFGNDNLKGFSISLTVGLVISLFTSLYMTRLIFDFWLHKRWMTQYNPMRLFSRPNINFMAIRKQMFVLTAVSSVLGLALFLWRGEKVLNVDFTKGTAFGGRLAEPLPMTGDGKGLLDRLSEEKQKEKLKVSDVYPALRNSAEEGRTAKAGDLSERTYLIKYEGDDAPKTVTLANKPEGATEAEQMANLKARASALPDVSVEQVFLSGENLPGGTTKSFTLRTTEREKEVVQVILDRLLKDDAGKSLLSMTAVTVPAVPGPAVQLAFENPTSVSYVRDLLEREFALAYRFPAGGGAFELEGVSSGADGSDERKAEKDSGKYKTMALSVGKNPEFVGLKPGDAKFDADRAALQGILTKFKGVFEARPVPERLETFDPTLAADTKAKALYAIVASWAAILLYLWFRFGSWAFGAAAVVCLIHDLCFTLGCIAACHYLHPLPFFGDTFGLQLRDFKIDLAAVAALLTLVGYSVNDTIVVFDRIREVRGKSAVLTEKMINDSVNQTLSRTVLAALTVFLVVVVLYFFGGEGVHLFSFVMVMGVLVGTYSSIYIASPLLLFFGEGKAVDRVAGSVPAKVKA